jgi:DNA-binding transcriptional ArsR family regulator
MKLARSPMQIVNAFSILKMTPSPAPKPNRVSEFDALLTAIADKTRWKILRELVTEPLPASELAKRVGTSAPNVSKHMRQLLRAGVVLRGYGNLYRIPAEFLRADERVLDFGPVTLRIDQQPR